MSNFAAGPPDETIHLRWIATFRDETRGMRGAIRNANSEWKRAAEEQKRTNALRVRDAKDSAKQFAETQRVDLSRVREQLVALRNLEITNKRDLVTNRRKLALSRDQRMEARRLRQEYDEVDRTFLAGFKSSSDAARRLRLSVNGIRDSFEDLNTEFKQNLNLGDRWNRQARERVTADLRRLQTLERLRQSEANQLQTLRGLRRVYQDISTATLTRGRTERGMLHAIDETIDSITRGVRDQDKAYIGLTNSIAKVRQQIDQTGKVDHRLFTRMEAAATHAGVSMDEFKQETRSAGLEVRAFVDEKKREIRVMERNSDVARKGGKAIHSLGDWVRDLQSNLRISTNEMILFQRTLRLLSLPAMIAVVGVLVQSVSTLAAGIVALTAGVSSLAVSLAGIPPLITTAAQTMSVWKIATTNLGQSTNDLAKVISTALTGSLKELQNMMDDLPAEAAKFALMLRQEVAPGFAAFRDEIQGNIFDAMTEGLRAARPTLSSLREELVDTSRVLASFIRQGGERLALDRWSTDLNTIAANTNRWLRQIGPGLGDVAEGFREVAVAGAPVVDIFIDLANRTGLWFRNWAMVNREGGNFNRWAGELDVVLGRVTQLTLDFGASLVNVLKAGRPVGRDLLGDLGAAMDRLRDFTGGTRGQSVIADYFRNAEPAIREFGKLLSEVALGFVKLSSGPGLAPLLRKIRTELFPAWGDTIKTITAEFAPAFVNFLVQSAGLIRVMVGEAGPLRQLVDTFAGMAMWTARLLEQFPVLRQLFLFLLSGAAIMRTFRFAGAILGINLLINRVQVLRGGFATLGATANASLARMAAAGGAGTLAGWRAAARSPVRPGESVPLIGGVTRSGVTAGQTPIGAAGPVGPLTFGQRVGQRFPRTGGVFGGANAFMQRRAGLVTGVGAAGGIAATLGGSALGGTAGSVLTAAGIGASLGSIIGPWGTAVGAAGGAAIGLGAAFLKARNAVDGFAEGTKSSLRSIAQGMRSNIDLRGQRDRLRLDVGDAQGRFTVAQQTRLGLESQGVGGLELSQAIRDEQRAWIDLREAKASMLDLDDRIIENNEKIRKGIEDFHGRVRTVIGQSSRSMREAIEGAAGPWKNSVRSQELEEFRSRIRELGNEARRQGRTGLARLADEVLKVSAAIKGIPRLKEIEFRLKREQKLMEVVRALQASGQIGTAGRLARAAVQETGRRGGGRIGGPSNTDATPVLASGGEFFVTGGGESILERMTFPGVLDWLEGVQPPHFQKGGRVPKFQRGGRFGIPGVGAVKDAWNWWDGSLRQRASAGAPRGPYNDVLDRFRSPIPKREARLLIMLSRLWKGEIRPEFASSQIRASRPPFAKSYRNLWDTLSSLYGRKTSVSQAEFSVMYDRKVPLVSTPAARAAAATTRRDPRGPGGRGGSIAGSREPIALPIPGDPFERSRAAIEAGIQGGAGGRGSRLRELLEGIETARTARAQAGMVAPGTPAKIRRSLINMQTYAERTSGKPFAEDPRLGMTPFTWMLNTLGAGGFKVGSWYAGRPDQERRLMRSFMSQWPGGDGRQMTMFFQPGAQVVPMAAMKILGRRFGPNAQTGDLGESSGSPSGYLRRRIPSYRGGGRHGRRRFGIGGRFPSFGGLFSRPDRAAGRIPWGRIGRGAVEAGEFPDRMAWWWWTGKDPKGKSIREAAPDLLALRMGIKGPMGKGPVGKVSMGKGPHVPRAGAVKSSPWWEDLSLNQKGAIGERAAERMGFTRLRSEVQRLGAFDVQRGNRVYEVKAQSLSGTELKMRMSGHARRSKDAFLKANPKLKGGSMIVAVNPQTRMAQIWTKDQLTGGRLNQSWKLEGETKITPGMIPRRRFGGRIGKRRFQTGGRVGGSMATIRNPGVDRGGVRFDNAMIMLQQSAISMTEGTLVGITSQLNAQIRALYGRLLAAIRSGRTRAANQLQAALTRAQDVLAVLSDEIGVRINQALSVAEVFTQRIQSAQTRIEGSMERRGLDAGSIEGLRQVGSGIRRIGGLLNSQLAAYRKALNLAIRGNASPDTIAQIRASVIGLQDEIYNNVTASIVNARDLIRARLQRPLDIAQFKLGRGELAEQRLELQQRIAGTFETGGAERADLIRSRTMPAIQEEIKALERLLKSRSLTESEKRDRRLELDEARNRLLEAELRAMESIKETNASIDGKMGSLAFEFGGQRMTDLISVGVGA